MTAVDRAAEQASERPVKPLMRIPCSDWSCKREHEWLPVGPTRADYHVDERKP